MLPPLTEEQRRPSRVNLSLEEIEEAMPVPVPITHPHQWNVVNVSGVMFEHVCIACGDYARENFPEKCDLSVFTWDEERRRLFREDIEKRRPSQELLARITRMFNQRAEGSSERNLMMPIAAASFIGTDQALAGNDATVFWHDEALSEEERDRIRQRLMRPDDFIIAEDTEDDAVFGRQHLSALESWFRSRREVHREIITPIPDGNLSHEELTQIYQEHTGRLAEQTNEGIKPKKPKKDYEIIKAEVDEMKGTEVYYYCVRALHSEHHYKHWKKHRPHYAILGALPLPERRKQIDHLRTPKFVGDPTGLPFCLACKRLLTIPYLVKYYIQNVKPGELDDSIKRVYKKLWSYLYIDTTPRQYPDGWDRIMNREKLHNPPETAWHGNDFKGSDVALLKGRSFLDVLADTGRIPRREEALPRATAFANDP